MQAVLAAWGANQEIMVGTNATTTGNFVSSHMFQVINVNAQTGQVELHNPWGTAASDPTRAMTFWASIADVQANGSLITAQGATAASLKVATSTGFANNLTDAHFDFGGGHELMTRPNGTTVDLTDMRLVNFTDGTVMKFAGSPLVDDLFYNASNHDVWNAHVDASAHFMQSGWKEGRDPNALFSTSGYLAANADVAKAGVNPLSHYDTNGWKEGRDPSAGFDNELYLARNADVKAAGIDPLMHYLNYGQAEGRQAYAAIGRASDFTHGSFDSEFYRCPTPTSPGRRWRLAATRSTSPTSTSTRMAGRRGARRTPTSTRPTTSPTTPTSPPRTSTRWPTSTSTAGRRAGPPRPPSTPRRTSRPTRTSLPPTSTRCSTTSSSVQQRADTSRDADPPSPCPGTAAGSAPNQGPDARQSPRRAYRDASIERKRRDGAFVRGRGFPYVGDQWTEACP